MYYPNHQIRSYCVYLGSLEYDKRIYDMGVYIQLDKSVSHAIVFGSKQSEYMSGSFINQGIWEEKAFRFQSILCRINEELYKEYVKFPHKFPLPNKEQI